FLNFFFQIFFVGLSTSNFRSLGKNFGFNNSFNLLPVKKVWHQKILGIFTSLQNQKSQFQKEKMTEPTKVQQISEMTQILRMVHIVIIRQEAIENKIAKIQASLDLLTQPTLGVTEQKSASFDKDPLQVWHVSRFDTKLFPMPWCEHPCTDGLAFRVFEHLYILPVRFPASADKSYLVELEHYVSRLIQVKLVSDYKVNRNVLEDGTYRYTVFLDHSSIAVAEGKIAMDAMEEACKKALDIIIHDPQYNQHVWIDMTDPDGPSPAKAAQLFVKQTSRYQMATLRTHYSRMECEAMDKTRVPMYHVKIETVVMESNASSD